MLVACDLFTSSIKFQRLETPSYKKIKKKLKQIKILKVLPEKKNNLNLENVEVYWGNRITTDLINKMPKLKWIHYGSTGISKKIHEAVLKKKLW